MVETICAPACEDQVAQSLPGVIPPCAPACAPVEIVDADPPETIEGAVTRTVATGAGSVAAGAASVTIVNVGEAAGTVLGAAIEQTEHLTLNAYFDPALNQFVRLPEIAYDGTGTELSITRQA